MLQDRYKSSRTAVWDQTVALQGEVGQYIVMARRKGNTWYIGGITNWTARDLELDLSPLTGLADNSTVLLYADGANAHRKGTDHAVHRLSLEGKTLRVHMAPGGGFLATIGENVGMR